MRGGGVLLDKPNVTKMFSLVSAAEGWMGNDVGAGTPHAELLSTWVPRVLYLQ